MAETILTAIIGLSLWPVKPRGAARMRFFSPRVSATSGLFPNLQREASALSTSGSIAAIALDVRDQRLTPWAADFVPWSA